MSAIDVGLLERDVEIRLAWRQRRRFVGDGRCLKGRAHRVEGRLLSGLFLLVLVEKFDILAEDSCLSV